MTTQESEPGVEKKKELAVELFDSDIASRKLKSIRAFQRVCQEQLKEGLDYGKIPGTPKPTLLKPGAEKIVGILGLDSDFVILEQVVDWTNGFFHFVVKWILTDLPTGIKFVGVGECNSKESKYRYRWLWPSEVKELDLDEKTFPRRWVKLRDGRRAPQHRLENEDTHSLVNTILKMAKKRALVDAALLAGRLSDIFTQDIEDEQEMPRVEESGIVKTPESKEPNVAEKAGQVDASQPMAQTSKKLVAVDAPTHFFDLAQKELGLSPDRVLKLLNIKNLNELKAQNKDLGLALAELATITGKPIPKW